MRPLEREDYSIKGWSSGKKNSSEHQYRTNILCIVNYESAMLWYFLSPLIGKDGDDVIDKIICELTGTESINTQT